MRMHSFKKILVPVDFTVNTEVAINKSLELIDDEDSEIHLLHVKKSTAFKKDAHNDLEIKLTQWKEAIEDDHPSISVHVWMNNYSSIQVMVMQKAQEINADLIVIGQSSSHSWLPALKTVLPMRLATATHIPVLTVKPGALKNKTKTVVVPVDGEIPEIKIQALDSLCTKTRLNIHLVTFANDKKVLPEVSASVLLQMFQRLKARLHCPVEYAVLNGSNRAKAILNYAEKNSADILLVYPKKETQLSWWDQHISDVLPAHSKMQVLAVQPITD